METGGGDPLAEWLETLNLSEYSTIFTSNGLTTLEQIRGIDKPSLNSIGIVKLGHVTRLVKAAEKLVNSGSNSPVPTAGMNGSELTSSLSAPQLKRPPPVPTRRSVRRSPSPAAFPQKQSSLLESTHANTPSMSPDVSRSPTPTGVEKPRPAPRRHKPLSAQNSDPSILEMRRRSSPDIIVSLPVSTPATNPVVVEPSKPTPRRLVSPSRNKKHYENVGRSTTLPQSEKCRLEQSPTCNTGLPPPAPPRRTTSIKTTTSEIMKSEDTNTRIPQTVSSPSLQMYPDTTNHAAQVPPIPPKITEEEEVSQPVVPPKDLFLSDLPAPIQPRISSLDALENVATPPEQLVPKAVTPEDASSDISSSDDVEVIAVRKVSPAHTAPLYENVLPDDQPPALPPKSNTPPGFRPPTPPTSDNEEEEETVEAAISVVEVPPPLPEAPRSSAPFPPQPDSPPPSLPPKTIHLLPPAPPVPLDITDTEDEDYSSDDSGEDRPRMVITSSRRQSTDILLVSVATPDSTITSPTSPMSPLSNTSSDAEMTLMVVQQKFTSDLTDEMIAVNQPSSESALSSHKLVPHYDQVTLKRDHSTAQRYENVSLNPGESHYDSLLDLDMSVCMQQAPGNTDYDSLAPRTSTIPPHYQQVPSCPKNTVYDEVELGDPLSARTSSYSSRRFTSSTDHYSSPEPNAVQTDNTYSTIASLNKPPTPPSYTDHLQQNSADIYASVEDESVSSQASSVSSNVAFSVPGLGHAFPQNLRDHRAPSASTLPTHQPPKEAVLGYTQSVRAPKKPTNDTAFGRSISAGGILETDGAESSINPSKFRSGILEDAPRTKEGYLYKRGGRRNDRPWQKRWIVFIAEELKYYKTKGVKESEALNSIPLKEMIDVKKVNDFDQPHRFDLVIINRVFQFYAESEEDCKQWISVLHAAIGRYNPSEDSSSQQGGTMHNPDKQGVLMKQGHTILAGFKNRYVALKGSKFAYYEHKEDFEKGKPIHTLDMRLASVRPDTSGKNTCRFTITMPNQRSYVFQATNTIERKEWIDGLTNAVLKGLNCAPEENEGKKVKSVETLERIQENPANRVCADCTASDPVWGVVNRGLMVCIECSGVHRAMGVHISKVRSVELDQNIWTDTLIELIKAIGNDRANKFWLHHSPGERLAADAPREIREQFIRSKYESKKWVQNRSKDNLGKELCDAVTSDDLMRSTELIVAGANVCYANPELPEPNTPISLARAFGQTLQVELLEQNGALICRTHAEFPAPQSPNASSPLTTTPIYKKGYLYKTGSDRQNWKRRFCKLDNYKGIEYFKSDTDMEVLGVIRVDEMLGVSRSHDEDQSSSHKFSFEVITPSRAYLFSADSEDDMISWIDTISLLIPADIAERLGYEKVGFLSKRSANNVGWKRMWFALHGKKLSYFKKEREEIASIDLRRMTDYKGPEQATSYEASCTFSIVLPDRTYQLRADSTVETESWLMALKHTQVSGIPLSEQQLTSSGIPVLVHKCLQFIEQYGLDTEGLYRKSGEKRAIRGLEQAFNQDARGVYINPENYTVHDVTGCLKQFFRRLPDPLLTHNLYHNFLDASQNYDHETEMHHLQVLIEQLPGVNKETLKRMIGHLMTVMSREAENKMSQSNLVSLFGPTLMTVDGDAMSFADASGQYACISHMMTYYKWLFQVDEKAEEMKEEKMEDALRKIQEANEQHLLQSNNASLSGHTDFLITIFIDNKDGIASGMKVTAHTSANDVIDFVSTTKSLPPRNYALFLVVGDAESERPLYRSERVLAAQALVSSESFFCLKPNTFADNIEAHMSYSGECLHLFVRERRKWKKYPCCVRDGYFIQFKDGKGKEKVYQIGVNDVDLFVGIEQAKLDVKNPLPGKYPLCLRARMEDNSRYLCAETAEDRKRFVAAVIKNKYPNGGIQTPIMPVRTVPLGIDPRNRGVSVLHHSSPTRQKLPIKKSSIPTIDEKGITELHTSFRKKSPSPQRE